jgi:hypothetical protein
LIFLEALHAPDEEEELGVGGTPEDDEKRHLEVAGEINLSELKKSFRKQFSDVLLF